MQNILLSNDADKQKFINTENCKLITINRVFAGETFLSLTVAEM